MTNNDNSLKTIPSLLRIRCVYTGRIIMSDKLLEVIKECLINLDGECVLENIRKALSQGIPASKIVLESMSEAMREIGKLYEEGEYFIAELIEAAEIFKDAMKMLEPKLKEEAKGVGLGRKRLRIVLGTVKGDVHDIGKTIVKVMLQAVGHEVIDLGVDVSAEKFVEAIEKYKPHVLGMSALLTTTMRYMGEVIKEIEKRGLRKKVFIIIGGAPTSEEFAKEIGADAWAKNAVEAIRILNKYAEMISSE